MNRFIIIIAFAFQLVNFANAANIMFFIGISSYSHKTGTLPLAEKLAQRGHSVTFVSPFPSKKTHPNITDVVPSSLREWVSRSRQNKNSLFYKKRVEGTLEYGWFKHFESAERMCETLLSQSSFIEWLSQSKFDLMIIDGLCGDCAYGMAYKLSSKVILYSTSALYPWHSEPFGFSIESSWIPDAVFHNPVPPSLYHRIISTLVPLYFNYLREYHYFPKLQGLFRDKLKITDMPAINDYERNNVSLIIANQHFADDYPNPLPPNIIRIGGIVCDPEPENLPSEILDFINEPSSEGFVYVSFGSFVQFSTLPHFVFNAFVKTFTKFKHLRFLWKADAELVANNTFAKNIYVTSQWIPQQAALAHPKIKAFVTHGGIYGIQEALCHPVPLIVFPVFSEQDYNAIKIGTRGYGIPMDYTKITEQSFTQAMHEILHNKTYTQNVQKASREFLDRPESPLEKAVWWTEFVLRHNNTHFLRPGSVLQSWWMRRHLDVWLTLLLIAALIPVSFTILTIVSIRRFKVRFLNSSSHRLPKVKAN